MNRLALLIPEPTIALSSRLHLRHTPLAVATTFVAGLMACCMTIGLAFGLMLGGTTGETEPLSFGEILTHNTTVALLMLAAGMLTFGILAVLVNAVASFLMAFELGVAIDVLGLRDVIVAMPHAPFEVLAFLLLCSAGTLPGVLLLAHLLDLTTPRVRVPTIAIYVASSLLLLVLAAYVESHFYPTSTL